MEDPQEQYMTQLLNDRDGLLPQPKPPTQGTSSPIVQQLLRLLYNELIVNETLIAPLLYHTRPFVIVLSSLFLAIIIMQAIILVLLILRR